ncbi:hypothetical protein ACFE04_001255 [Oxalis oulophora]
MAGVKKMLSLLLISLMMLKIAKVSEATNGDIGATGAQNSSEAPGTNPKLEYGIHDSKAAGAQGSQGGAGAQGDGGPQGGAEAQGANSTFEEEAAPAPVLVVETTPVLEVFIFIVEFRSGAAFYLEELVRRNGDLDLPELSVVMVDDDGGSKKKGVSVISNYDLIGGVQLLVHSGHSKEYCYEKKDENSLPLEAATIPTTLRICVNLSVKVVGIATASSRSKAMVKFNDNETLKKTREILKRKIKDDQGENSNSRLVYSTSSNSKRSTRSQAAPDWTVKETLILVNAYAAVELDCVADLSSHQRWKIITEQCTAFLGVSKSLNQCRRKWDTMLQEFKRIKQCGDSRSFWEMERRERKALGLPEEFDPELFEAIENVVSMRQDEAGSDQENDVNDPDICIDVKVETDLNDVVADLGILVYKRQIAKFAFNLRDFNVAFLVSILAEGSRRQKQESTLSKCDSKEMGQKSRTEIHEQEKILEKSHLDSKRQKQESTLLKCDSKEMGQKSHTKIPEQEKKLEKSRLEKEPRDSDMEKQPSKDLIDEKTTSFKENERVKMETILRENAERVHQIINNTEVINDLKDGDDLETIMARRQADQLISCWEDIVKTLEQYNRINEENNDED